MTQTNHQGSWRYEEGFTLFEVLATIIIMGIIFAIASATFFNVVEARSVDSAANQLAADLRQAHSNAVNRLAPWEVKLTSGSHSYQIGQPASLEDRDFCDDGDSTCDANERRPVVNIPGVPDGATITITFNSDGSASVAPAGSPTTFEVTVDGNPNPPTNVTVTPTTSRVNVV